MENIDNHLKTIMASLVKRAINIKSDLAISMLERLSRNDRNLKVRK